MGWLCVLRTGVGEEGWAVLAGQKSLQEQGGGYLIDPVFARGAVPRCVPGAVEIEKGVGSLGGVALVEEMVGEVRVFGEEGLGEGEGLCGLGARRAVGVEGVADQDGCDVVLADETGDGL